MRLSSPFSGMSRVVGWLSLMRLIGALGFSLSMPFLAMYLHEEMGISMTLIGVMLTAAGVLGSMASTIGGALSDRWGRKGMLIWFLILRGLSFGLLGWLVWVGSSFAVFSAVFVLSSILGTSIFPLSEAIIADVTPSDKRAEAYGILRVAVNAGWGVGPAVGGMLATLGYYWLFYATALSLGAAALLVTFTIPETNKTIGDEKHESLLGPVMKDRKLLIFLAVGLLMFLARGQLISSLSVYLSSTVGFSKMQIGWLYALNGGMVALLQVPTTSLAVRYRPLSMLTLSGILYGLGYFMVGFVATVWQMVAAMLIITLAEMVETPTASSYVTELAPPGMVGSYLGAFHFIFHLGWTVGPMVGGVFLDVMPDPLYAWTAIAILAVVGGLGFAVLRERQEVR